MPGLTKSGAWIRPTFRAEKGFIYAQQREPSLAGSPERLRGRPQWPAFDPVAVLPWDLLHRAPRVARIWRLLMRSHVQEAPSPGRWPAQEAGSPTVERAAQRAVEVLTAAAA